MGTNTSKVSGEDVDGNSYNSNSEGNIDPRSPTPEIVRTPLQVNYFF